MRDLTNCLSATKLYSLYIRFVFVTDRLRFHIRIRTLSVPIPNPKNMVTDTVSLLSILTAPFSPLCIRVLRSITQLNTASVQYIWVLDEYPYVATAAQ
jgi:hypothetical protein